MGSFFKRIKDNFNKRDLLVQLILINITVFIAIAIYDVLAILFKLDSSFVISYLAVSSNIDVLIRKIWTIFTYMFVHTGFFHILFNMLILYIFGRIFLQYFSARNLASLYILGGLAGALFYILAFNTIPYFLDLGHAPMIGASASVSAIIFATAFYQPNLELRFFFIGTVKIVYIALVIFLIDFISLGGESNPGGHVAHIGGAALGYIYAKLYLRGNDITKWISKIIDFIVDIFKREPKKNMNISYAQKDIDYQYNKKKKKDTRDIDSILDKIKSSGYKGLNEDEKKKLFDASKD